MSRPSSRNSLLILLVVSRLSLVAVSAHAASVLTLSQYIAALQSIRAAVPDAVRGQARALTGAEIDSPNGRFAADVSLLDAVARGERGSTARLDATIAVLQTQTIASPMPTSDPRLLARLRAAEAADNLQRGGELIDVSQSDSPAVVKAMQWIERALRWIRRKIKAVVDWLVERLWPKVHQKERSIGNVPFIVIAVVIVIVAILTILALEIARRSRRRSAARIAPSEPAASRRDEDPLSRGANEWERYATDLALQGRMREAIRAWYHAVLVTLYAAGTLHFRKGRTNWEYVSLLRTDLPWRPQFVQLTRRFEEEWYGHDESGEASLDECSALATAILSAVRRGAAA